MRIRSKVRARAYVAHAMAVTLREDITNSEYLNDNLSGAKSRELVRAAAYELLRELEIRGEPKRKGTTR